MNTWASRPRTAEAEAAAVVEDLMTEAHLLVVTTGTDTDAMTAMAADSAVEVVDTVVEGIETTMIETIEEEMITTTEDAETTLLPEEEMTGTMIGTIETDTKSQAANIPCILDES